MLNILWVSIRAFTTPFVLKLSVSNVRIPFPKVCFLRYNVLACASLLIIYYFRTEILLFFSMNFSRQRICRLFDLICELLDSHNFNCSNLQFSRCRVNKLMITIMTTSIFQCVWWAQYYANSFTYNFSLNCHHNSIRQMLLYVSILHMRKLKCAEVTLPRKVPVKAAKLGFEPDCVQLLSIAGHSPSSVSSIFSI